MFKIEEIVDCKLVELKDSANVKKYRAEVLGPLQFDTREMRAGETFVALKGVRDGHSFLPQAVKAGAKGFLVSKVGFDSLSSGTRDEILDCGPVLVVEDTLDAIAKLAAAWRREFKIPVFAVGGSNGKTSTKDMIAAILLHVIKPEGSVLFPQDSFNNEIGIPCIVSRLNSKHKAAIFEIGGNDFGEIGAMSEVAKPDAVLITNVGDDHLEFFRDRRGAFKANWEMVESLEEEAGTWFVNLEDPILRRAHEQTQGQNDVNFEAITYSIRDSRADYYAGIMERLGVEGNFGYKVRFSGDRCEYAVETKLRFPGTHNVQNALAAFAVAVEFYKCDPESSAQALEKVELSKYRSEVIRLDDGGIIFNDCYNANPSSFDAALKMAHDAINGKFCVAVGDFLEVGDKGDEVHRAIGESAVRAGAMGVGAAGEFAQYVIEGAVEAGLSESQCKAAESPEKLKDFFLERLQNGEHLLVKGSRGAHMEKLVSEILVELDKQ